MFGKEREAYRKLFLDVYQKMGNQQMLTPLEAQIAAVLAKHPYYHHLFHNDKSLEKDFLVRKGEENPFLHMSLHLALQDQVKTDRPCGIKKIYQQLLARGLDAHEVEHQMIAVLADILWNTLRYKQAEDNEAQYLQKLQQLLIRH